MKKKILLLSTTDSHLEGHAWSEIEKFDRNKYDVKLVTLTSNYNDPQYSLIKDERIYDKIIRVLRKLVLIFKYGIYRFTILNKRYCFFNIDYTPVSTKQILKKYNNGNPDYIVLYWHDFFITPQILRKLYDKTNAQIVYVFTDEFPLGGGCHYPCECKGYITDCSNCPALKKNNSYPKKKMKEKLYLLGNIQKIVVATSYSMNKAKESALFSTNTSYINYTCEVKVYRDNTRDECRKLFKIPKDTFVIMFGAMHLNEERKGLKYFIEAMNILKSNGISNYIILAPGNSIIDINDFKVICPGKLSFKDLCNAYIASDVFVCPTIADSGPMMLKYSLGCGTPVVSFPVGYAIDHIQHKKNGYLARYMDAEDLSNGILYFYDNQQMRDIFYNNSINSIEKFNNIPFWGNSL